MLYEREPYLVEKKKILGRVLRTVVTLSGSFNAQGNGVSIFRYAMLAGSVKKSLKQEEQQLGESNVGRGRPSSTPGVLFVALFVLYCIMLISNHAGRRQADKLTKEVESESDASFFFFF